MTRENPQPLSCARQEELVTLRAEHQQDAEDLFKKIVQASQVGGLVWGPDPFQRLLLGRESSWPPEEPAWTQSGAGMCSLLTSACPGRPWAGMLCRERA